MSTKPKTVEGITRESTQEMIAEALEAYPEKGKKKTEEPKKPNISDKPDVLDQIQIGLL